MKLIDLTGLLCNDMWEFGQPFPHIHIEARTDYKDGFGQFNYTAFDGLHSLSGTYVETPAHYLGYENSYLIADVPLEKLVGLNCVVLNVTTAQPDADGMLRVTLEDLLACENSDAIQAGDAILVGVGWGDRMWTNQDHFPKSPYFTREAFYWMLDHNPCVIGTDTSSWEKLSAPAGFFDRFYQQNVLMLAGLKNLAAVTRPRVKLSILPMKIDNSCAAPCRVFVEEACE